MSMSLISLCPKWLLMTVILLVTVAGIGLTAIATLEAVKGTIHYEIDPDGRTMVDYEGSPARPIGR